MITIGIDPGLTGAVAFVDSYGTCSIEDLPTLPLPGTGMIKRRIDGRALAEIVRRFVPAGERAFVVIEDVHAMGGSAVQTMGSMMRSVGAIETVIEMLRLPIHPVSPRTWKAHYGLKADKAASLDTARALYPSAPLKLAKHHNRAEALLIAHYGLEFA
jgi:hypothetical protein